MLSTCTTCRRMLWILCRLSHLALQPSHPNSSPATTTSRFHPRCLQRLALLTLPPPLPTSRPRPPPSTPLHRPFRLRPWKLTDNHPTALLGTVRLCKRRLPLCPLCKYLGLPPRLNWAHLHTLFAHRPCPMSPVPVRVDWALRATTCFRMILFKFPLVIPTHISWLVMLLVIGILGFVGQVCSQILVCSSPRSLT